MILPPTLLSIPESSTARWRWLCDSHFQWFRWRLLTLTFALYGGRSCLGSNDSGELFTKPLLILLNGHLNDLLSAKLDGRTEWVNMKLISRYPYLRACTFIHMYLVCINGNTTIKWSVWKVNSTWLAEIFAALEIHSFNENWPYGYSTIISSCDNDPVHLLIDISAKYLLD